MRPAFFALTLAAHATVAPMACGQSLGWRHEPTLTRPAHTAFDPVRNCTVMVQFSHGIQVIEWDGSTATEPLPRPTDERCVSSSTRTLRGRMGGRGPVSSPKEYRRFRWPITTRMGPDWGRRGKWTDQPGARSTLRMGGGTLAG